MPKEEDIVLLLTREEARKLKTALAYLVLTENRQDEKVEESLEREGLGRIWERLAEKLDD